MVLSQTHIDNLRQRKTLFWEVDPTRIEQVLRESDDWVILRVFEYGTISDIYEVIALYGDKKVKAVLTHEKLKPLTAAMAYFFCGIDRYGKYGL